MSELKAYIGPAPDEKGLADYYLKSEADKVIAELKDENERLKATPEQIMKEVFDKVLIYPHDMVRLDDAYKLAVALRTSRRALWLARAERAIVEAEHWDGHCTGMYYIDATDVPDEEDDPYARVKGTTIGWYKTWMNVERKCRAKAEQYK